ncbi:hypothetical protein CF050_15770 [Clostridium botulinum]|uniref:sce7726 family protein n=1 Tax=Clostridium botulinum TaxID=1491 RepID=UPI00196A1ACD|nr:sce7726 family protein [Clostridium botulinum]MBN3348294.1 hypothetical protein [Clostridium botulinum]
MEEIHRILKSRYTEDELTKLATKLDKEFRVNYFWNGWDLLEREVFSENEISKLKLEYRYNEIYNFIIMKYGRNETIVKYNLIKQFMNNSEDIGLMEFNVGNSRLDIGKINGNSYAYEIKTELDNTLRLEKQIKDYEKIFEFIYVVCHYKHLENVRNIVPKKVGIKVFNMDNYEFKFNTVRKAQKNKSIKKEFLLEAINSKEYEFIIKKYLGINKVPLYKKDKIKLVDKNIKKIELIEIYKEIIKLRQSKKWHHIKQKFNVILPIELQDIYSKEY